MGKPTGKQVTQENVKAQSKISAFFTSKPEKGPQTQASKLFSTIKPGSKQNTNVSEKSDQPFKTKSSLGTSQKQHEDRITKETEADDVKLCKVTQNEDSRFPLVGYKLGNSSGEKENARNLFSSVRAKYANSPQDAIMIDNDDSSKAALSPEPGKSQNSPPSSQDIIPDTPDVEVAKHVGAKRIVHRSFLNTKAPLGGVKKQEPAQEKNRKFSKVLRRKLNSSKNSGGKESLPTVVWDSGNVSFNALVGNATLSALPGKDAKETYSGALGKRPSVKGLSPAAKKIDTRPRSSPEEVIKCKTKLNLSNSVSLVKGCRDGTWNDRVDLEGDEDLTEVLGELNTSQSTKTKTLPKKPVKKQTSVNKLDTNLMDLSTCDIDSGEPDTGLDDLLDELQHHCTVNNKNKSSLSTKSKKVRRSLDQKGRNTSNDFSKHADHFVNIPHASSDVPEKMGDHVESVNSGVGKPRSDVQERSRSFDEKSRSSLIKADHVNVSDMECDEEGIVSVASRSVPQMSEDKIDTGIKGNISVISKGKMGHCESDVINEYDSPLKPAGKGKDAHQAEQRGSHKTTHKPVVELGGGRKKAEQDHGKMEVSFDEESLWLHDLDIDTVQDETDQPLAHQYGRYEVIRVKGQRGSELELQLESQFHKKEKTCFLQGFWADTHVLEGDIVNIIGTFNKQDKCYVTDLENYIIINPDYLISGTSVVSSVQCMRRSVLTERFKGCDSKNIYMLYGNIIHCFFQEILQKKMRSQQQLEETKQQLIQDNKFLHEMYGQGVTEDVVTEEMDKYMPKVQQWCDQYMPSGPSNSKDGITLTKVVDIEENVWSPRYGIKGKIDLTVEIHQLAKGRKKVPLELKTGRPTYSVEHKGQVTLYSLMMSERQTDPEEGLLLYLKEPSMKAVPAVYANKRGLLQLRNEMAHHLTHSLDGSGSRELASLPPPINSHRSCSRCPQLLNCTLYQRSVEKWNPPQGHAMDTLLPESTGHLTQSHVTYYSHWCRLLTLELTSDLEHGDTKGIWCKSAQERESQGMCLSNMTLDQDLKPVKPRTANLQMYLHRFVRSPEFDRSDRSLQDVGPSALDSVVVSCPLSNRVAISMGSIRKVCPHYVDIMLDRDLKTDPKWPEMVFRIDKYGSLGVMSINFTNVALLMADSPRKQRLRELIIDGAKPEYNATISKAKIQQVKPIFKNMNKPQKAAVLKVLMSKDYVLIKGYPGTGKTSTIVGLVRILHALGQSVLLASYTNSAVDNILLKLKKYNLRMLRVGRTEKVHPDLQEITAERLTKDFTSVKELEEFYNSKLILATTCLGINHPVFSRRTFDVCIIDEASQVLQPACLGPLFCSQKFVLVGDPRQLPPVVRDKTARLAGMSTSMFAQLEPHCTSYELNLQYRMNSVIMSLSNGLIYQGALQCGSEEVANQMLEIPEGEVLKGEPWWVQAALSSEKDMSAVFIDTEKIYDEFPRTQLEESVRNSCEADVILKLVKVAVKAGVPSSDIGVIAIYRQQITLIRDRLAAADEERLGHIEVNTVDTYQGRDKPVIIVSFVKAGKDTKAVSEILKDERRLNVALTRAKHKLILVGHAPVLQHYEPLVRLMSMLTGSSIITLDNPSITDDHS